MKYIYLLLLLSCSVTPPDVYVFRPLEQHVGADPNTGHIILRPSQACVEHINELFCGFGVSIVSGKEIFVGNNPVNYFQGKSWNDLREQSVLVPAEESYAPIVTYIINSCKKLNCNADVTKFKVKIDSLVK